MSTDFKERISKNNSYYDKFGEVVASRIENRNFDKAFGFFLEGLDKHDLILDIGSGSGAHRTAVLCRSGSCHRDSR